MDHFELEALRRTHPAWRLLAADSAPLVLGFLQRAFLTDNVRGLPRTELVSKLEDHLFDVRHRGDPGSFPRSAAEYLDDWAADDKGWLRRFYPPGSDEPSYDLTAAAERALEFLASLRGQALVSTESRLLTIFELLRQLTEGTEPDADRRAGELERRRAELDRELERLRAGHVDLLDDAQVKDRFLQLAATARALLSDFRELEQRFRALDLGVRERIATWDGGKGSLLEEVFGRSDAIAESDQGRSFRAFWDLLMAVDRQEELSGRLSRVLTLPAVQALAPDRRLGRIHHDWFEAGEVVLRTVARLSEQLRRYLDDRVFLENRRILELVRSVEQQALAVRDEPPSGTFAELDDDAPGIALPLDRPLFAAADRPRLALRPIVEGDGAGADDALFDQVHVDAAALRDHLESVLRGRRKVTLAELVAAKPLDLGLAELVGWLGVASDDARATVDEVRTERITWHDPSGGDRAAHVPLVVFSRSIP